MIKFFRTLRQQLLSDNKFNKYLVYAIGEIILVVIGILIALQINNWNESEKSKHQEQIILKNILKDLESDKIGLNKIIEARTSTANSAKTMVSYYEGVKIEKLSDYYFHFVNVMYWQFHHPRNTTFEELVNSGNMSIIRNPKIKELLLDVNASYQELFEVRRHMYDDYTLYLYTPYASIIDYEDGIVIWENPNSKLELSQTDVKTALKNKAIKNGFTLAHFNNLGLKDLDVKILKSVELNIALIKREINQ
ncbi:MAG: hypothetical protein IPO78_13735 [Saprospiraceae bacterium]|nr:hypothetical protein [Saprospiraceae bacterium]MBK9722656.1 hypothetical protein [Saprospiraceae bacterium]